MASSIVRSISRAAARHISRKVGHSMTSRRLQREAAARPESQLVETAFGKYWMSPIEVKLYDAMRNEGLSPVPQYCIEGYHVDFAFPYVKLAVEADGSAYHSGERRERDRRRDWVLSRAGWSVKRFYGSTIHDRASNCAYVVRREVESRRPPSER